MMEKNYLLINLGLKAIYVNPKICSPYKIHLLFNHWRLPINLINYIEILYELELIEKIFFDSTNYNIKLTEKGEKLARSVDIQDLLLQKNELDKNDLELDKKKVLDFFSR